MITFTSSCGTVYAPSKGMKVGELAKRTGLSVRTLHYYDQIGLLQPSQVTAAGHRVYGAGELVRLQQIKSLRQLGFSLEEIRHCLDAPDFSPARVLALHIQRLRQQIEDRERLVLLLETLAHGIDGGAPPSPDDFIRAIEGITMVEHTFTPEELREIKARGEQYGAEHIRAVEAEWPTLIAKVKAEMQAGTPPTSDRLRPLATRWRELVREFTGGNPRIEEKMRNAYAADPKMGERSGVEAQLFAYVGEAIRALGV